jgi:hypothetical protein
LGSTLSIEVWNEHGLNEALTIIMKAIRKTSFIKIRARTREWMRLL